MLRRLSKPSAIGKGNHGAIAIAFPVIEFPCNLRSVTWRFPHTTSMKSRRIDKTETEFAPISVRAMAIGAQSIGALAVGALAIGALALGAVAIGRLAIGRAKIKRMEIDELVVKKLRITDSFETPLDGGTESR
jgi:hypothetical protein